VEVEVEVGSEAIGVEEEGEFVVEGVEAVRVTTRACGGVR
jgi:hypothetical protein